MNGMDCILQFYDMAIRQFQGLRLEQDIAFAKNDGRGRIEDRKAATEDATEPVPTALSLCLAYHHINLVATAFRERPKPILARQIHIDRQDGKPLIVGCLCSQCQCKSLDIKASGTCRAEGVTEARMLRLHVFEPLFKVFVVHLIDHNHFILTAIRHGKQAGKELPELHLLLPTSDDDADVIHLM